MRIPVERLLPARRGLQDEHRQERNEVRLVDRLSPTRRGLQVDRSVACCRHALRLNRSAPPGGDCKLTYIFISGTLTYSRTAPPRC